ncbi:MAG: hypothetical protein KGQ60_07225, partial [Planctomycetes bacterium]|nr:hypothetical protein [Planctomycetota bacterium]
MAKNNEPIVLELAPLPREQMGPFLILGLDKTQVRTEVDEHWADRVKWARRNLIKVPLEDINWAREALNETEKRLKSDIASMNADTADGMIAALSRRYGASGGTINRQWQPLDSEIPLADYNPVAEMIDSHTLRASITPPVIPDVNPDVESILERLS